jgi:hypothetical protein
MEVQGSGAENSEDIGVVYTKHDAATDKGVDFVSQLGGKAEERGCELVAEGA